MIDIRLATSPEEIQEIGQLKLALAQYLICYAESLGIIDKQLYEYSVEKALKSAPKRISYLIYTSEILAGSVQIEEQISEIDGQPIIFVHSLYIKEEFRNKAIGGYVLRFLCRKYKKRIEHECWYNIPSHKVFQKVGFIPLITRFMLPIDSSFYASDQK